MKKGLKKLVAVAFAAAMSMSVLAGCGKKADSKTWKIGTNAEFAPFEFISSANGVIDQYSGIDMEIIKKIADDNGYKVEINNMEFDSLIVSLSNKQIDGIIAGMTVTDERKEEVDFSEPYYVAKQVMIVKNDSTIAKAEDMKDKKIAVVQGYTGEFTVKELGFKSESFKKGTEAVLELENGKADVVVIDSATANAYIKDYSDLKIVEDDNAFTSEEYAIAVQKGNKEMLDMVNASIKKMKEDGTIDSISAKYADMNTDSSESDAE